MCSVIHIGMQYMYSIRDVRAGSAIVVFFFQANTSIFLENNVLVPIWY